MSSTVVLVTCVVLFVANAWILLGHREMMGRAAGDRSEDPFFRQGLRAALFGFILIYQALLTYRRVRLAQGRWHDDRLAGTSVGAYLDLISLPANDATFLAGVGVFLLGAALRVWAVACLGRLFTFEIGIRSDHEIVERGPYTLIRHPSYTGYILILVGLCIAFATMLGLLITVVGAFAFFSARIRAEEAMLVRHFGSRYEEYQSRTRRLIPFLY